MSTVELVDHLLCLSSIRFDIFLRHSEPPKSKINASSTPTTSRRSPRPQQREGGVAPHNESNTANHDTIVIPRPTGLQRM